MSTVHDPVFEGLWKKVLDDWDDDARHAKFIEYCQSTGQLAEAAARYKGMKGDRERSEQASKRLQGVAILAVANLEAMRTTRPKARKNAGKLVLILFFLAATAALLFHLVRG